MITHLKKKHEELVARTREQQTKVSKMSQAINHERDEKVNLMTSQLEESQKRWKQHVEDVNTRWKGEMEGTLARLKHEQMLAADANRQYLDMQRQLRETHEEAEEQVERREREIHELQEMLKTMNTKCKQLSEQFDHFSRQTDDERINSLATELSDERARLSDLEEEIERRKQVTRSPRPASPTQGEELIAGELMLHRVCRTFSETWRERSREPCSIVLSSSSRAYRKKSDRRMQREIETRSRM